MLKRGGVGLMHLLDLVAARFSSRLFPKQGGSGYEVLSKYLGTTKLVTRASPGVQTTVGFGTLSTL